MAERPKSPLLFDENLAARIVRALVDIYPGSMHVGEAGLLGASDDAIWQHARAASLAIVTKDQDFQRFSIFHGPPPKVSWVGLGNCSTEDVIRLLRDHRRIIDDFLTHREAGFLALA